MGTEKYPDENDYGEYLAAHGGYSNAFTAEEHTNYFFEVAAEFLDGALDRFAQFFIAPLFNPSGTERELLAVDSEHKKNVKNDHWRLAQLERTLSREDHPYSGFGTGNLMTLRDEPQARGENIRDVLIEFYNRYYSANLMRLVVYGRESLEKLESMVVTKFVHVPNRNRQPTQWSGMPLSSDHFGKMIRARTIKDLRTLYLIWQLPDLVEYRLSKPEHYFTHLLGHEGRGSILSLLKVKGWATDLGAGTETDTRGFSLLQISIELSPSGAEHIDEIIKIVFQYIQMLRTVGLQPWVYEESQKLEQLAFRFKEKGSPSSFAYRTAMNMHYYTAELTLKGPLVSMHYDERALNLVIDHLTSQNFRALFASKSPIEGASLERWYGTEYHVTTLSPELLSFIAAPPLHPNLCLPTPNAYIAENLQAKQPISPNPVMHPDLVLEEESGAFKLWHKQDDLFAMPRGCFQFLLRTPLAMASPRDFVVTYLLIDLLQDSLTETVYEARIAGLRLEISQAYEGVAFSLCGYDCKLPLLLETVISKALKFQTDPKRFAVHKDKYDRWLRSLVYDNPYSLTAYFLNGLQMERNWWYWQKLEALASITAQDIDMAVPLVFKNVSIEALCHGNYVREEAIQMYRTLRRSLSEQTGKTDKIVSVSSLRSISLTPRQHIIFSPSSTQNANSAIEFYLQIGSLGDLRLRVMTQLFTQIFNEPFFDMLRTQEQLGYIVRQVTRELGTSTGLRFIIQSERDPIYLDARIEFFISTFVPSHLERMSAEDFAANVAAMTSKLLAKKRRMSEETSTYWNQILLHQYEFGRVYSDAAAVRDITLEDMKWFVREYVLPRAPQRRKLAVHLWGERLDTMRSEAYGRLEHGIQFFEDPNQIASVVGFFPPTYPLNNTRH